MIGAGSLGLSALLPAAQGTDWPQFRGADRNNISKETGLLRKWPAAGPKRLWSVPVEQ
ncbi:MAG: polyvinylalcohol dehydrogenase, partial [Bryobacteraceae bacterium]